MELVRRPKNWDILNNFGPQNVECSKSNLSFKLRYFFHFRKCYFNLDCRSQTSNLWNKHVVKHGSRLSFWPKNLSEMTKKWSIQILSRIFQGRFLRVKETWIHDFRCYNAQIYHRLQKTDVPSFQRSKKWVKKMKFCIFVQKL